MAYTNAKGSLSLLSKSMTAKEPVISPEMITLLEGFVNKELYAQYFYRNASNYMQQVGYFGAQKFFLGEAENEGTHYQKIVDFLNDVGVAPKLAPINPPTCSMDIKEVFDQAYELEVNLGKDYNKAAMMVMSKDMVVFTFLQEFVTEQRKSVGEYGDLLAKLARCGNNEAALLEFDEHLVEG
jgi:ferritin